MRKQKGKYVKIAILLDKTEVFEGLERWKIIKSKVQRLRNLGKSCKNQLENHYESKKNGVNRSGSLKVGKNYPQGSPGGPHGGTFWASVVDFGGDAGVASP